MILSKKTQQEAEHEVMYLVLKDLSFKEEESGDDGVVDTPVPIPNTEVKHRNGDCIRKERGARCRAFFLLLFTLIYKNVIFIKRYII